MEFVIAGTAPWSFEVSTAETHGTQEVMGETQECDSV